MSDTPDPSAAPSRPAPHLRDTNIFGDDTSPEVSRYLLAAYRRMSGEEKIARVRALNRATIALALADIRQRHPQADEREVMLRLATRRHGADIVRDAFGWDAEREGY